MCGIVGALAFRRRVAGSEVEGALDLMRHRGPDSTGIFARGRGAIGQTRLAVIDLHTGDPPITNERGDMGVVLNGEIYNYRALRGELQAAGHAFATSGDTEVLVHLLEDFSPIEACRRLEGMFAFAVFDSRSEQLVVGRDRLGKKPLYYWAEDGQLVFASEIKALVVHPDVPRRLAPNAISAYLTFGYVPSPETFYEHVRSLPPGHVLTMSPGRRPSLERYWTPPRARPAPQISMAEAGRDVMGLLTAAVERRLVADVPVGAFLSGGLDSSAIVAIASRCTAAPVKTFTIGFDDHDGFDERPYAQQVAQRYGTDHTEFVVKPDAVELIERLVWHHDQPFGDSSAIPMFLLSELTSREVTVALSGDGGDELFAGYERFAAAVALQHYHLLPTAARRILVAAGRQVPTGTWGGRGARLHRFLDHAERGMPDAYIAWLSYVQESCRRRLLGPERRDGDDWAIEAHRRLWLETAGSDPVNRLLELNLHTYLLDDLLVKADRMSMAHSLEVRSPFLDARLVEYAFGLPGELKLSGLRLKRVLKQAVADLLPEDIVQRRKRGFGVPLDRWFRTDLRAYVESMLGSPDARLRAHLDPIELDSLLAEHRCGHADHGQALWALLTLEVFLRREDW